MAEHKRGYEKVEFDVKDMEVFIQQFAHFYILFWNSLKKEYQTYLTVGQKNQEKKKTFFLAGWNTNMLQVKGFKQCLVDNILTLMPRKKQKAARTLVGSQCGF